MQVTEACYAIFLGMHCQSVGEEVLGFSGRCDDALFTFKHTIVHILTIFSFPKLGEGSGRLAAYCHKLA